MHDSNWKYEYEVEHERLLKAQAEIKTAVQEEREACAKILEDGRAYLYTSAQLAEAIRQRQS